jgi:hypothetical protein
MLSVSRDAANGDQKNYSNGSFDIQEQFHEGSLLGVHTLNGAERGGNGRNCDEE